MNSQESLIVAELPKLEAIALNSELKAAKESALQASALIGKVTDRDSKIIAVRAQQSLKSVISKIEKSRITLKEPLLIASRKLDAFCAAESLDLDKELGRVSQVVKEFDDAERRRVLEEERLQRLELERIEREKQADLKRISDEQAAREAEANRIQDEIDSKAREVKEAAELKARQEREAAEKLAREATNKKQREAAEKARIEAEQRAAAAKIESDKVEVAAKAERERVGADLRRQAEASAAQIAAVEEKAGDAAYCAAKPVEITKVAGQRMTSDFEITKINEWALMKARPDLVREIKFDLRAMKDELKRGVKLPGVEAKEVFKSDVRVGKELPAINV